MLEPPAHVCCVLTLDIMQDPCILVGDGFTYERAQIEEWIATHIVNGDPVTSPITGTLLPPAGDVLVPNLAVRWLVADWVVENQQQAFVEWWWWDENGGGDKTEPERELEGIEVWYASS